MSYRPATIVELETYWRSKKGASGGIVGNQKHCGGYHLGKDRIFGTCACKPDGVNCVAGKGWADNSLRDARDRAGLTNAASALDLGRLNDSLPQLWKFSAWLAGQCLAKAPDCADIREVIFWSPERQRVVGATYRNGFSALVNDYGDLSHKTHTHISLGRDAEGRDKTAPFRRYFESSSDNSTGGSIDVINAKTAGRRLGQAWISGPGHQLIDPTNLSVMVPVADGDGPFDVLAELRLVGGSVNNDPNPEAAHVFLIDRPVMGYARFVLVADVRVEWDQPPVPEPVDCNAEIAAAIAADRAKASAKLSVVWSE